MSHRTYILLAIIVSLIITIYVVLPVLSTGTNCGGNTYALATCHKISMLAQIEISNNKNATFSDVFANKNYRLSFKHFTGWGTTDYFIFNPKLPIISCTGPIVMCCNQFDNVPQPTIWNFYAKNPAYAVASLEKSSYLISPSSFHEFDKSSYVLLSTIMKN